jgi:hypothetical protein
MGIISCLDGIKLSLYKSDMAAAIQVIQNRDTAATLFSPARMQILKRLAAEEAGGDSRLRGSRNRLAALPWPAISHIGFAPCHPPGLPRKATRRRRSDSLRFPAG